LNEVATPKNVTSAPNGRGMVAVGVRLGVRVRVEVRV
jgi:hypothetical protein